MDSWIPFHTYRFIISKNISGTLPTQQKYKKSGKGEGGKGRRGERAVVYNNNSAEEQNSYPQTPLKFLSTLLPENYSFMKNYVYLLLFLLFLPLIYFRDFTPNNELRYLSIANEAIGNGRVFTFTDHGIPYADKPPLYLWIVMSGKILFGEYNMLFLALFSLLPALLVLYVMDRWVSPYLSSASRLNSQLMLISSGLFAGSAIVLRMDMLMCLFITLSLFTFYKIYSGQGKRRDKYLLPVYIFLGLFSKGPVGLLVPLLSIAAYLMIQKKLRDFPRYMGSRQWGILLLLCALWFTGVYTEGGKDYLHNLLFHQTFNRAVHAFHHQEPAYYYLLALWYALAPWSFFYIVTLISALFKRAIHTPLEKFFLTVIVLTLGMLSVFSSKLAIYLLPVFPFFTYLSLLLMPKLNPKILRLTLAIPAFILLLIIPGIYVVSQHTSITLSLPVQLSAFTLSAAGLLSLYFLYRKTIPSSINSLAAGILLALFIGSFSLPRLNAFIGLAEICKQARTIATEYHINDFYFYKFRSGEYLDIYLKNDIRPIHPEDLGKLSRQQNFILFLRNKDLSRNRELRELLLDKTSYRVGNYSLILSEKGGK